MGTLSSCIRGGVLSALVHAYFSSLCGVVLCITHAMYFVGALVHVDLVLCAAEVE